MKNKCLIPSQKQLLDFFDNLLDIILTEDNNNNSNNNYENENENENDYKIKKINNYFKMIGESESFKNQIKLLKKTPII